MALAKGWRFSAHGGTWKAVLKLEDFPLTKTAGAAVLKVQAAPVTPRDLDRIRGLYGALPLPAVAGTSGVGIVTQAGGAFKEGDRAVLAAANPAGSYATLAAVDPAHLIKVPAALPVDVAATLAVGPFAAYQILKLSGLKSGDSLALDGEATLLGKSVALLAKSRGITVVSGAAAGKDIKFALSLQGGRSASSLLGALGHGGQLLLHVAPSDEATVLDGALVADKSVTIRSFAPAAVSAKEAEAMVEEVVELVKGNALGLKVVRHDLAKLLEAVEEVTAGPSDTVHILTLS
uniref:NDUEG5 n=1 Tax=Euglena gracilis TaxID=3039 RepID=UPI002FE4FA92|eukprot:EG_transcript_18307